MAVAAAAQLPDLLRKDFKALQLPVFDGYRPVEALNWINHTEGKIAALQIPPPRAVLLFQGLFTGTALDWYRELPAVTTGNYDALRQEFRRRWVHRYGFHEQNVIDLSYGAAQANEQTAAEDLFYGATQANEQTAEEFAQQLLQ